MKTLLNAVTLIACGLLVGAGIRAGEWLIPAPDTRVIICFADELDQLTFCAPTSALTKVKGGAL